MSQVRFEFVQGVLDLIHNDVGHSNGPKRTGAKFDGACAGARIVDPRSLLGEGHRPFAAMGERTGELVEMGARAVVSNQIR